MQFLKGMKSFLFVFLFTAVGTAGPCFANDNDLTSAVVTQEIFAQVKKNDNWKLAFLTAKDAQVVFMNIRPHTNPNNEIGMETHKFDQIIFVVEGEGKAILSGKATLVKAGSMIFIPQGVEHNVINLSTKKPLKILSVYSATDIPANASYKKKSDAPQD